ncbi:MAG: sigma-70 family RNA polymerase sigma factor [Myxococcales bacterium]|jgi:RNA polymerase sigma-32 factor|nr:sigma-70 family RNA polymerase sigma factor [Myxococcales bacterium]MBL0194204.1 sigma-70 family RNA polymerase sigma factor [Myxococcales bacterium]HQY60023.1 sigma-70 family RNA polymerase sigma factor [Polyangiaceae bacterium]
MGSALQEGSFPFYRQQLAALKPLTREAEQELARRFLAGDRRAGGKLVSACLPFVVSIALEYRRWGVPLEDIVQQGNLGLLRAAAKFDPGKDCRLATYAAYWIRAEIREYVVRTFRVVRVGTTKGERRALRAFRTGRDTSAEALAEVSGLSAERIATLLPILAGREASLDAGLEDQSPMVERLGSPEPTPEENASANERQARASDHVKAALGTLTAREELIVRERIMTEDPPTLQALGARLGVSKERVRQIEERARGKLRRELGDLASDVSAIARAS